MLNSFLILIAIFYTLVVIALFVYGINFFYLTLHAVRYRHRYPPPAVPPPVVEWPTVTIQLPIYNERYVVERLVNAVAAIDYPRDKLQIQLLDDSTDDTVTIAQSIIASLAELELDIAYCHRQQRVGYKAGALQEGLATAKGEFVAIFDADFVPTPSFLRDTIPYFTDESIAFVQARWDHLNQDYSLLTHLQSLSIDAHFMVEQLSRHQRGFLFNFNGTAGVWRRAGIEAAGGWTHDTLTEDLDLSYRAFLCGQRGVYLPDVVVPAELPVHISGFRRQQHRWARGSLECAYKLIPSVWRSELSPIHKIQATLHLTGYGVHILLFTMAILYPIVLTISNTVPEASKWFGAALILNITALAPTIFFAMGQNLAGRGVWRQLPRIFFIMVLGIGMMMNTVRAGMQILTKKEIPFERTAKFGIEGRSEQWVNKRYQLALDPIVYVELLMAAFNIYTVYLSIIYENWPIGLYAALFTLGLLYVAGVSVWQTVAVGWQQRRAEKSQVRP